MGFSVWLLAAFGLCGLAWSLRTIFTPSHDLKEPTLVPPTIPWVGHVFGVLKDGTAYYSRLACVQVILFVQENSQLIFLQESMSTAHLHVGSATGKDVYRHFTWLSYSLR